MEYLKVKKVHYTDGVISKFMLTDDSVINNEEMIRRIKDNEIINYTLGVSTNGVTYVRSMPDSSVSDNLSNLETF